MAKKELTLKLLVTLICSLALMGCDDSTKEKDKAVAEAAEVKTVLAKVRGDLERIQSERDSLTAKTNRISEELEKAKLQLALVVQANDELQEQVGELAEERDAAIARAEDAQAAIEKLMAQLQEEMEKVSELQGQVEQLEADFAEPDEGLGEESYEDSNEIEDSNEMVDEEPNEGTTEET